MRKINLSNDTKRDAEVAFGTTFHRSTPVYKTADGKKSVNERRVRATMKTTDEALLAQYGAEGLADALIAGDPEVDMEQFGLKVEGLKKVFVTPQQKVAYGVTLSEHVFMAVDVLHLITLLEHEHPHSLLAGDEFARPAQRQPIESDISSGGLLRAHFFLCAISQKDVL